MLLEWVGLVDRVDVFLCQLFGGQQQCIVIVCVLVLQLKVLLFDEFIFVLDLELVVEVFSVIEELVCFGIMLVIVIYELSFVCCVVDYVVMMDQGWVIEQGMFDVVFEWLCQ